jgi:hypothetical protein
MQESTSTREKPIRPFHHSTETSYLFADGGNAAARLEYRGGTRDKASERNATEDHGQRNNQIQ